MKDLISNSAASFITIKNTIEYKYSYASLEQDAHNRHPNSVTTPEIIN